MFREWPEGFARIPDDSWVREPVERLALSYDTVEDHGWYRNLDRTVADLGDFVRPGMVVMDYSGGTGILTSRLLEEIPEREFGILILDSSRKFLRLAIEKLGRHQRVAFRLIGYLRDERRLQLVDEVLDGPLLARGVDAIVSTNAIHLYYDLDPTLASWRRSIRRGGRVFVQSGNIGLPYVPAGSWIIDETVEAIDAEVRRIVAAEPRWAEYRPRLADPSAMESYDRLRRKFFLPVRPIAHYIGALERAGFRIDEVTHLPIEAHVDQWYEFLATYHEGVLGWVGGSERIEGTPAPEAAVADRLTLIQRAMETIFEGKPAFRALWTYLNAVAV